MNNASSLTNLNSDVSIFPNPTKDVIHLLTDLQNINTSVFNVYGKLIISSNEKDIDMSHLPTGIYIVNIQQNGKVIKNEKIMKN